MNRSDTIRILFLFYFSQLKICRIPPPSEVAIFTWKMRSVELNGKSIFRFFFFELWSFRDQIVRDQIVLVPNCPGPNCPWLNCPGPNCPGPNCPDPHSAMVVFSIRALIVYIYLYINIYIYIYLLPASLFFLHNSKNKIKLGNGAQMSGAETARRPVVQRRIGGAKTYPTLLPLLTID